MDKREELIKIFSKDIREILKQVTVDFEQVQEIRLRVHAPLLMIYSNREYYITREGNLSMRAEEAYLVTRDALKETLDYMSSYSLYAFEEEIRQGFITIQGGHRIGIAGKIIGKDASPVMLYAVETSIQLTLVELNENLREVYVEVYTQPDLLDLIHQHTTAELQKIFSSYLPKATVSDFYEIEIGTAGIMRSYMAHPCDVYFTLERKLERFLRTNLRIFEVPKEEIEAVIASVLSLDIRTIADDVMQQLFRALEMQYSFTLNKKSVFKTEE